MTAEIEKIKRELKQIIEAISAKLDNEGIESKLRTQIIKLSQGLSAKETNANKAYAVQMALKEFEKAIKSVVSVCSDSEKAQLIHSFKAVVKQVNTVQQRATASNRENKRLPEILINGMIRMRH